MLSLLSGSLLNIQKYKNETILAVRKAGHLNIETILRHAF